MKRGSGPVVAMGLLAVALTGCAARPPIEAPAARPRYTDADVRFVSGMIPHHGQAILIAGWAQTHGAGERVRPLCERLIVSQRDEIATMQTWLRDHGEPVPGYNATPTVAGRADEPIPVPGMLTSDQLSELDRSRGRAFDRLLLTFMIQHHRGALSMVEEMVASGGAQDETVYRLAAEAYADQKVEIDRMERMLIALGAEPPA